MLALALCCLAAALATPPAATDREAELMRMIQELKADIQELKADAEKQRNTSAMVQELRVDMSKVRQQRVPAQQLAAAGNQSNTWDRITGVFLMSDKVKEYFNYTDTFFNDTVRPLLLNPATFYVAIVLDLQWHFRFHFAEFFHRWVWRWSGWSKSQVKPMMFARRLGLNILILHIYFDKTVYGVCFWIKGRPFVSSVFLILFDTVVLFYFLGLIGWLVDEKYNWHEEAAVYQDPFSEGDDDDGLCPDKGEATNIYEDLTLKFQRVFPIWVAQMALVALYVGQLNKDKDTKDIHKLNFAYWVIAVLFQMYGGDAQVGEPFNDHYWTRVLNSHHVQQFKTLLAEWLCCQKAQPRRQDSLVVSKKTDIISRIKNIKKNGGSYSDLKMDKDVGTDLEEMRRDLEEMRRSSFASVHFHHQKVFSVVPVPFWFEWRTRWIMDLAVNSVARSIILYTVPILVSIEEPLDFVKDLTAVMFITMLDDGGRPKAIEEMLVKLKFYLEYNKATSQQGDVESPSGQGQGVELDPVEKWYVSENRDKFEKFERPAVLKKWQDFAKMEEGEEGYSPPLPCS